MASIAAASAPVAAPRVARPEQRVDHDVGVQRARRGGDRRRSRRGRAPRPRPGRSAGAPPGSRARPPARRRPGPRARRTPARPARAGDAPRRSRRRRCCPSRRRPRSAGRRPGPARARARRRPPAPRSPSARGSARRSAPSRGGRRGASPRPSRAGSGAAPPLAPGASRAHGVPSPSARTCATARPASWLSETWSRRMPRACSELGRPPREGEPGRLAPPPPHLHLAPPHPHREAGAERLQRRLLRGEAGSQVLGRIVAGKRVGQLRLGEDALEKPVLPALHQAADPRDLDDVDADPDDQCGSSPAPGPDSKRVSRCWRGSGRGRTAPSLATRRRPATCRLAAPPPRPSP